MNEKCQRIKYQRMMNKLLWSPLPYPEGRFKGKGIVVCAGGERYFPCAWVCLKLLRHLGCHLPIELWYRGRSEMNSQMIELVTSMGVECIDAYEVAKKNPVRQLNGWELKPYAIINSSFEDVLSIDADNVPARNPEFLLSSPEYEETGAIF